MRRKYALFLPVARQVDKVPAVVYSKMVYALCFSCREKVHYHHKLQYCSSVSENGRYDDATNEP